MGDSNFNSTFIRELIQSTISGEIFRDENFQKIIVKINKGSAQDKSSGPANADFYEFRDKVKLILDRFKEGVSSRSDRPFDIFGNKLDGDGEVESIEESAELEALPKEYKNTEDLIGKICRIYESEISLFDEQKTHFEKQQLINNIYTLKKDVKLLFNVLKIDEHQEKLFFNYVDFLIYKSGLSFSEEITDIDRTPSYYAPFTNLLVIDQDLDLKKSVEKDEQVSIKNKINEFYESCTKDFPDTFYRIPIDNDEGEEPDFSSVTHVDLYLYFGYIKNYKHSEVTSNSNRSSHYGAFLDMQSKFNAFYKRHKKLDDFSRIEKRIFDTNKIYFINNLISTLADSFQKHEGDLPKNLMEINKLIKTLRELADENKANWTYFTHYKLARLYLGIASYLVYLYNSLSSPKIDMFIEQAKMYLNDVKVFSKDALKKYNEPGGSLLRFYPDYNIITGKSKVFSISGFCRSHGGNFSARVLGLEIDTNEISGAIQSVENNKRIEESITNSEKSVTRSNIEILSIFAALVMFVSGNIQIYQYISSLKSAIIFMVFFAFSLGIFGLVLREWGRIKSISTNGSTKEKLWCFIKENLLFDFLIILAIICGFFLYFTDDTTLSNKKYIDEIKADLKQDLELSKFLKSEQTQFKNEVINIHENDKYQDARN